MSQWETGLGQNDPKPFPSAANLQATCDYPSGILASGFEVREEEPVRRVGPFELWAGMVAGGFA